MMGIELSPGPPFQTGEPKMLFQVPLSTVAGATDGSRFLLVVTAVNAAPSPFTVVLNWPALLKK